MKFTKSIQWERASFYILLPSPVDIYIQLCFSYAKSSISPHSNNDMMADTCTAQPNSNRHSTNNDVITPSKRLPQHKVEPSTSSGEKVGGNLSIDCCTDPCSCMTLYDVLKSFNAPVSEEQMWALIFQSVKLYRDALQHSEYNLKDVRAPASTHNLNIHKDGSVHVSFNSNGEFNIFHFYFC